MCTPSQLKEVYRPEEEATGLVAAALKQTTSRRGLLTGALAFSVAPLVGWLPASAATNMTFSEIAPGVFVHQGPHELQSPQNRGDMANASFIVGNDSVAVIDTLGSAKAAGDMRAAIKSITDRPIRYVINSHMHPDHVFGNAAFKGDGVQFVGHHKLLRGLDQRAGSYLAGSKAMMGEDAFAGSEVVLPTLSVDDRLTLDLGGRKLELEAQSVAHTDNDLIITDSATGTLFLGDLLFSGHIPTLDGSLRGWLALIEQLDRHEPARVVPGHGPHAMTLPEAMGDEQRYWSTVAADVRQLIKEGRSMTEATKTAGQSERGKWEMFDQYHVRNVTAAYAELEWEE
ncbi:MAG: quinoprotein relay system zinc metallohydrolase 2 [Hyphomicrobium sp.]|jgi:quinoprotein relay system zinc metallohydrolase 2